MSQFSTGELAKAAEVSVRTVQYYDQRGILTPSEVTEGGRRIYHESDLERLQVICFLSILPYMCVFQFKFNTKSASFISHFVSQVSPNTSALNDQLCLRLFYYKTDLHFTSKAKYKHRYGNIR